MTVLAVDTSAKAASVCLASEEKIIGEFFIDTALTHSQTLMPMLEQLAENTGVRISEVDAIAVNAGPGSFTGVRIGVAAVKGLAFANGVPCVAVSTLESMAYNFLGTDCVVCAAMDARCSQVYNALFRVSGSRAERLCGDRALALSDLRRELEQYDEPVMLAGDGAALCAGAFGESLANVRLAPMNRRIQTASSVALAALERVRNGGTLSAAELMPVYLRLPQAQRELNKRLGRET
ncbi:MAG: tRNA (adenosine(37)-N6)-threonylcarbamoyltransferase complex dimerization subunit type 1 TsaB [Ruminococcus sp.]